MAIARPQGLTLSTQQGNGPSVSPVSRITESCRPGSTCNWREDTHGTRHMLAVVKRVDELPCSAHAKRIARRIARAPGDASAVVAIQGALYPGLPEKPRLLARATVLSLVRRAHHVRDALERAATPPQVEQILVRRNGGNSSNLHANRRHHHSDGQAEALHAGEWGLLPFTPRAKRSRLDNR